MSNEFVDRELRQRADIQSSKIDEIHEIVKGLVNKIYDTKEEVRLVRRDLRNLDGLKKLRNEPKGD